MSLSGNVTPKEKTDAKSTPVAHALSVLKRTVVPLEHKQVKTGRFHFRSKSVKIQPEHDPAAEEKKADELKKRRAAVEFMNFIYEDDNSYRNPQQQMLFIRTLIDEPDYAEQILRTKASNERCNLAGLEEQLQTIIRKKSTSNKDAQNTQRKNQYTALLQIVQRIIPDYSQDAAKENATKLQAKDLKQPYGNITSPKIRQQFVLALLQQNKNKQKEILCAQAKSNYSHLVCLIAALTLDKKQLSEDNESYAPLLQSAKKILLDANIEAIQQLDLFGLVIFEQCVLEEQDKKEQVQIPKIEKRLSVLNLFGNGTAEAKKKAEQDAEEQKKIKAEEEQKIGRFKLVLIKRELKSYQNYLSTKYSDIKTKDDQLLVKKKWNFVSDLYDCNDYTAYKQYYDTHQTEIENILSTDRDSETFGLHTSKYVAAFFMTIACQNSDVLWKIKSKEMLSAIQKIMSSNHTELLANSPR